jgi:excisionase family DNA binding protein
MLTVRTLTRTPHGAPARLLQVRHAIRLRNTHDPQALLSLIDAATAGRLLSVSPSWLLGLARRGQIPHYQLGVYVRFDVCELKRWLEQHRRTAVPEAQEAPAANGH